MEVVAEQELPDGHFPTCPYPNPEIREAMELGLKTCARVHADLLLATDPDCDRCGIAVRGRDGAYQLLTGNEVGLLLLDFIFAVSAHPDPVGVVIEDLRKVMADARARNGKLAVVAAICGTDEDFQNLNEQRQKLLDAGVYVCRTNRQAADLALPGTGESPPGLREVRVVRERGLC